VILRLVLAALVMHGNPMIYGVAIVTSIFLLALHVSLNRNTDRKTVDFAS